MKTAENTKDTLSSLRKSARFFLAQFRSTFREPPKFLMVKKFNCEQATQEAHKTLSTIFLSLCLNDEICRVLHKTFLVRKSRPIC